MLLVAVQAYLIKKAGLIGVDELATIEILLVIFGLSSYSLDAFAHSAEATVGVSIGSKNKSNIFKSIKTTTEFALLFSIIIGIIYYFFSHNIISFFTDIQILRNLTIELMEFSYYYTFYLNVGFSIRWYIYWCYIS